ncbi:MAG: lipopolysaccharide kinase InaA family protein [Chlamydiales bacterium]|nr:lipopolysaccharide kinase InaA family protein [Chlamydiales bacterium]
MNQINKPTSYTSLIQIYEDPKLENEATRRAFEQLPQRIKRVFPNSSANVPHDTINVIHTFVNTTLETYNTWLPDLLKRKREDDYPIAEKLTKLSEALVDWDYLLGKVVKAWICNLRNVKQEGIPPITKQQELSIYRNILNFARSRSSTALDLSALNISIFPHFILKEEPFVSRIKQLALNSNYIQEVPREICSLKNLEQLDILNNPLPNPLPTWMTGAFDVTTSDDILKEIFHAYQQAGLEHQTPIEVSTEKTDGQSSWRTVDGVKYINIKDPSSVRKGFEKIKKTAHQENNKEPIARLTTTLESKALSKIKYHLQTCRILNTLNGIPGVAIRYFEIVTLSKQGKWKFVSYEKNYNQGDLCQISLKAGLNDLQKEQITFALLKAVAEMHKRGVYHTDLKPANVLLHIDEKEECEIGLTDFSDSWMESDISNQRGKGYTITARYAPLEALKAQSNRRNPESPTSISKDLLIKADSWGLGLTLYFLWHNGKLPDPLSSKITKPTKEFIPELEQYTSSLESLAPKDLPDTPINALLKELLIINPDQRPSPIEASDKWCNRNQMENQAI